MVTRTNPSTWLPRSVFEANRRIKPRNCVILLGVCSTIVIRRDEQRIEICLWLFILVGFWGVGEQTNALGLVEDWQWMNFITRGVIVMLAVMLLRAVSLSGDCLFRFTCARRQSRRFVTEFDSNILHNPERIMVLAKQFPYSHIAKIVVSGMVGTASVPAWLPREDILSAAKRAMQRTAGRKGAEMQYGLATLGTMASIAPFIGFFGTVVGLLNCFGPVAMQKDAYRAFVAEGMSSALLTTALGLAVAIPAQCAYNFFRDQLSLCRTEMASSESEMLSVLMRSKRGGRSRLSSSSLTLNKPQIENWEVISDSHVIFLLPLWASWLFFLYELARGSYFSG